MEGSMGKSSTKHGERLIAVFDCWRVYNYFTQVSLDFVSCWLQGLLPATLQQSFSSSPFSELPALQGDINTLVIF